jgi:NAD(P)-dependent dehydrogenase (short-subunit alcohol dehydrogenase family)
LLLSRNCNVVIGDLGLRPEAQKLIDDYTSKPRAVFVKTNVVIWDELSNLFDQADKEFGGADIVRPCLLPGYTLIMADKTSGMPRSRYLRTSLDEFLDPTRNWRIQGLVAR